MQIIKKKSRAGTPLFVPVFHLDESPDDYDTTGICLACGTTHEPCEPDTRRATCGDCGAPRVFGVEELFIMQLATFSE